MLDHIRVSQNNKKYLASSQDDDYVQLAAKHYYVTFGAEFKRDNVQKVVEECITTTLIEKKSMGKWIQLISNEHLQVHCHAVNQRDKQANIYLL